MVCDSLPTKVNQSVSQGVQNEEPYQSSMRNLLVSQHRGLREQGGEHTMHHHDNPMSGIHPGTITVVALPNF